MTCRLAAEQAAYWNGPGGEGWLAAYQRIQRAIGDIGDVGLAAAAPQHGEHVIDIGCGTGGRRRRWPRRSASPVMCWASTSRSSHQAARAHRLDNATFVVGDAATHPFQAEAYDLVFSRFGVMFFADPVAAFRNIRRALKPAGRLVLHRLAHAAGGPGAARAQPFCAAAALDRRIPASSRSAIAAASSASSAKRASKPRFEPIDRQIWMGDTVAEVVAGAGKFGPWRELSPARAPRPSKRPNRPSLSAPHRPRLA